MWWRRAEPRGARGREEGEPGSRVGGGERHGKIGRGRGWFLSCGCRGRASWWWFTGGWLGATPAAGGADGGPREAGSMGWFVGVSERGPAATVGWVQPDPFATVGWVQPDMGQGHRSSFRKVSLSGTGWSRSAVSTGQSERKRSVPQQITRMEVCGTQFSALAVSHSQFSLKKHIYSKIR